MLFIVLSLISQLWNCQTHTFIIINFDSFGCHIYSFVTMYVFGFFLTGDKPVRKTSFFKLWNTYVPFIVVGRPMTDLCWLCKQNNERIRRTANLLDETKMDALNHQMQHLKLVEQERRAYNEMVASSKAVASAANITTLGPHQPKSLEGTMHYSFDFAQQVHLPSSPLQPGPIYFLVPRKCGIFGVCADGLPQQINYLIDEGMSSSKGSNMVISLFHHFLEKYGLGETHMQLHCDNCSGQNKNKYLMWYLAWRVMSGLHMEISINFMPAGHTKFAPDWCFGLLKKRFRVSEVHCLKDLVIVVNSSTQKGINRAQLVGTEGGQAIVPVFNWQQFFSEHFRPVHGIKENFHFRFSEDAPGELFFKKKLGDVESTFKLTHDVEAVKDRLCGALPEIITPPGLSTERKEYLRRVVRPFVNLEQQDVLCP